MKTLLRNTKFLKWTFLVIVLVKLSAVFLVNDSTVRIFEDYTLAENLFQKGEFVYNHDGVDNHTFQFPVYPYLLFTCFLVFGLKLKVALVFQVLANCIAGVLLALFIRSFFLRRRVLVRENLMWIIAIVLNLLPFTNSYAYLTAHTFSFNYLILALFSWMSELYLSKRVSWYSLALFFGILLIQRSSLVVLFVFPVYDQFVRGKLNWKEMILIVLVSSIFPLSWSYRNYKMDEVFGMTSTTGKILWKGSIPESSGSNYVNGSKNYYEFFPDTLKKGFSKLSVKEQNEVYLSLYESNRSNTSEFIKGYLNKLRSFFMFRKGIGTEISQSYKTLVYIYYFYYIILIVLVILSLLRYKEAILPIALPFVVLGLFQAWFYVETRHRIIYEPVLVSIVIVLISQFSFKKNENKFNKSGTIIKD